MIKIIVLGSSAVFPFPRALTKKFGDYLDTQNYQKRFKLHDCAICKSAGLGGKDRRTRSSLAIVNGGKVVLIDAGPDLPYQLKKYNLKPDAVFITHHHADADYGLRFLPGVKVYSEKEKNLKPGQAVKIFGLTITPFRVRHARNTPTLGYRAEMPGGKTLAYMSDLSSLTGTREIIKDVDVLFADGSILERSMGGHLSILEQVKKYKEWGIKKVLFTHIGHLTLPHAELVKRVQKEYANADVAYDGQEIEF